MPIAKRARTISLIDVPTGVGGEAIVFIAYQFVSSPSVVQLNSKIAVHSETVAVATLFDYGVASFFPFFHTR